MVIGAHCSLFYSGNQFWLVRAEQESVLFRWVSNFLVLSTVPIFVFAAGFLLQTSLQKKQDAIPTLIKKKAVRLLIPYFLYGILWLVPTYTLFDIPSFGREKGASLIEGYQAMALGKFSDVAWFLLMLFWVTLLWILLNTFLRKQNVFYGVVVSAVLYFAAHFFFRQIDYYKLSQIDIYIIVFFVGAQFFHISEWIDKKVPEWVLIVGSLAGVIACVFFAQLSTEIYMVDCILKILIPIFFLTLSKGLCRTKAIGGLEKTAVYGWLCKNSLYLYLLQAPGIYLIFDVIYPIIGSNAFLCFSVLYVLTLLLDVVLTLIFVSVRKKL